MRRRNRRVRSQLPSNKGKGYNDLGERNPKHNFPRDLTRLIYRLGSSISPPHSLLVLYIALSSYWYGSQCSDGTEIGSRRTTSNVVLLEPTAKIAFGGHDASSPSLDLDQIRLHQPPNTTIVLLEGNTKKYLLGRESTLYEIESCYDCGTLVNLCKNSSAYALKAIHADAIFLRTSNLRKANFSCRLTPQLLSWLEPGKFYYSLEHPNDLYFLTKENYRVPVPTCHKCSPRACVSTHSPKALRMDEDPNDVVHAVPSNQLDSYPVAYDLAFNCSITPHGIDNAFGRREKLADKSFVYVTRDHGSKSMHFLSSGNLFSVDSCKPCPQSPLTQCVDEDASVHELHRQTPIKVHHRDNDALGVTVNNRQFRCKMNPLMANRRAAMLTPYHITPGGGEKYLLESARVFQSMGYAVDLFSMTYNVCNSTKALLEVASQLNVHLDPYMFRYFFLLEPEPARVTEFLRGADYDIFFLIGNEKIPQFHGIGNYNIFQCQFPFDLDRGKVDIQSLKALSSYDVVWVNSHFTRDNYLNYTKPWFDELRQRGLDLLLEDGTKPSITYHDGCYAWRSFRFPHVDVMYPPTRVTRLQEPVAMESKKDKECPSIVLLGRVFQGRQSKGHALALELFKIMTEEYTDFCVKLTLIGHVMPGHEDYAEGLKLLGAKGGIDFHYDADESEVYDLLAKATVQWHLTGSLNDEHDPASYEHFGISIVEGMAKGVIPIVLDHGGPPEIVTKDVGRTVSGVRNFVGATLDVLKLETSQRKSMVAEAKRRARQFSEEVFARQAAFRIYRGQMEQSILHIVPDISKILPDPFPSTDGSDRCNRKFGCAALIVEFRDHPLLALTVRNTMARLGPKWKLHVVTLPSSVPQMVRAIEAALPTERIAQPLSSHSTGQLSLVRTSSTGSVSLWEVSMTLTMDTNAYSKLLKQQGFWDAFENHDGVLVFQVDTLMLTKATASIYDFVQYDYVGAPWCKSNKEIMSLVEKGTINHYVGNGGFSWRTVRSMIECSRLLGPGSSDDEPEDRMFIRCFSKQNTFRVASWEVAKLFSVEVPCWDLEESMKNGDYPLALHATWYYAKERQIQQFLGVKSSCKRRSYLQT